MSSPRKRGAQPGNTNALTHGLYSRRFREIELRDLEQVQAGIEEELAFLRVIQSRMFAAFGDFDHADMDIDSAIKLINAYGACSIRIASLARSHAILTGGNTSATMAAIAEALKGVQQEFGI